MNLVSRESANVRSGFCRTEITSSIMPVNSPLPGRSCFSPARVYQICIVDDDLGICKAIAQTLSDLPCKVTYFTDPNECMERLNKGDGDLLITDVNMPQMTGLELLAAVKKNRPLLPVLLITGFGDIPIAVKAVKAGAFDFIEKPLDERTFIPIVQRALEQVIKNDSLINLPLTKTEQKILKMIVEGKGNKEIAYLFQCSVRTVENHRYRLMHKLNVDSTAALVRLAVTTGMVETDKSDEC